MIHNFRKHSLMAKSTASLGEPSEKTEKFTMQMELIFIHKKKIPHFQKQNKKKQVVFNMHF